MTVEYKQIDFKLESTRLENGKFLFTAKSLTSDFEKPLCLKRLARDSKNKHLIWRHRHPISEEHKQNHIYGNIVNSQVVDGHILTEYEAYGHTPDHLAFIEEIKEKKLVGDPLGISMRYRKYFDDFGRIIHLDVFEHSGTPFPKCEECLQIDEYIGEKENMPDEEPIVEGETQEEDVVDETELEEHLKKIDELEKALNSKTEALEGFKSKVETLEKEMKDKEESVEKETMTLEDRVKYLEEELEKSKEDARNKIDYLQKKPILDEMFELKQDLDEDEKEFYKSKNQNYLEGKLEKWRKEETKPFTASLDESADNIEDEVDEEIDSQENKEDKLNEEDVDKFCAQLPERTKEIMKSMIK